MIADTNLPETMIWSELAKARVEAMLVAHDVNHYDDLPMAISSHHMPYRVFVYSGDNINELVDFAVSAIGLIKGFGGEVVAWRRRVKCEPWGERWKLSMRFHILPAEADTKFWDAVKPKIEGRAVENLEALARAAEVAA